SSIIAILALSQIGMAQEAKTEVRYQNSIDPEAITLIEDMIEWAETDIQEGIIKPVQGRILIDNLNELLYKLED
ncbi:MAG: hypothetical protein ACYSSM_07565, partial [Planctomycetota bacterium]